MKKLLFVATAMACLVVGRSALNAQTGQAAPNAPAASTAQPEGINGKWHFVMDTPGGDREMDADFAVDSEGKVTGKYGNTDVAGTYKDGKMDLDFTMTSDESGETSQLKLEGKVDDTKALTGTWEFSEYSGTFKATRPQQ